jgi:hypothetical protein
MSTTWLLGIPAFFLTVVCGIAAPDNEKELSAEAGQANLEDAPLTIVFRKLHESPRYGAAYRWCWSINSAGQGQLTIDNWINLRPLTPVKTTRQKLELSAKQLVAIREVLLKERFFHLKNEYGPHVIHGGWSTLTVVAGDHVKQVRYCSSWGWTSLWKREKMVDAAPAVRIWVKVCEAVDPDTKVFPERKDVAKVLGELKR